MEIHQLAQQLEVNDEDIRECLAALAIEAYNEFTQTGNKEHIDRAVQLAKRSIDTKNGGIVASIHRLSNLGVMLWSRYNRTGKMADLEEAITVARQAVDLTPVDHPDRAACLNNLGLKLKGRYERTGEIADLEEAITVARQAVDLTSADHPDQAGNLNNLGSKLEGRYERTGEIANLEEAITVARQAVDLTPVDHPNLAGCLNNLGLRLQGRYKRTGEMADLEEAITVARQAVDLTPIDHPDRAGRLNNLGLMLANRYERTGKMADLEEAITVARQVVDLTPVHHPGRAAWLNNLGLKLEGRYKRTGEMADLEEAITVARQAVDLTPANHPNRAGMLSNLGIVLWRGYGRTGEIPNLEEAITLTRKAVNLTPADHPDRAGMLSNLGNKLGERHERTGEMANLEEAISVARQAVDLTPASHPDHAVRLHNLGNKLGERYERTGEVANLDEAIVLTRRAVHSTPADHPGQAGILSNLGIKIHRRYERTGKMTDLEEAITVIRHAANSTPADHPNQAAMLSNLGSTLASRYERSGEIADLEEAIILTRRAVDSTPAHHPGRAAKLYSLGNKLRSRYQRTDEMIDLEEASSYLQAAWCCEAAIPFHRVQAAAPCLSLLTTQSKIDPAIQLGLAVLDLLPVVNTKLLDRNDQQFVMSTFSGVAAELCACLLAAGRPTDALESLERGRAVIIGQLVDGRNDLSSLRQDHYDTACRYERLRDEINERAYNGDEGKRREQAANRRQEAMAEFDKCVNDIRGFAGHERFLLGQTVADMQECASGGTIVIVNITDFRSDAILVTKTAIRTLNLPQLLVSEAKDWLRKTGGGVRREERPRKNRQYLEYLVWLWDACVKQVLDAIDTDHTADDLPRIWWIGTGLGSSMPFHAAGVHSPGSTENAFSKAVSSYTPSIKTLGYSHRRARMTESTPVSLLIATMPTTPADALPPDAGKPCDLPGVMTEAKRVTELVPGTIPVQSLNSPSVAQVIDKMQDCSIAHFACHGSTDHADPSNSGLILQRQDDQGLKQDRLTVRGVSELNLPGACIAYLSACSTAENKAARLSDEVIHVVSGFQVAGFPHVVGCLWPSIDRICVEVAGGFYQSLLRRRRGGTCWGGQAVACAVREAVMAVREADMEAPLVWAQFVHFGA